MQGHRGLYKAEILFYIWGMNLSKDTLVNIAESHLQQDQIKDAVIYLFANAPTADIINQIHYKGQTIPNESKLFFIDLFPGTNWAHPSLYLLVDRFGNLIKKLKGEFPPFDNDLKVLKTFGHVEDWKLLSNEYVK